MSSYTRRAFLKTGSAILALPAGLAACDQRPATPDRSTAGHWEIVQTPPLGAWSTALLPTGKVLLFQDGTHMCLWDPETRQYQQQGLTANTNLFCAGLAFLEDGRLLAAGGHAGRENEEFLGVSSAEMFDPWRKRWRRLPNMAGGKRWYPTAATLPDGRVLIASGTHAGTRNEAIEVLDPAAEEWEVVARRSLPLYPWTAVRPGGELLFYGPQPRTLRFDWTSGTFRTAGTMNRGRWGGAGVPLDGEAGTLLAMGGGQPSTSTSELFEADTGTWRSIPSLRHSRRNPDLVLLPDGSVLAVGGDQQTHEHGDGDHEEEPEGVRMAEILAPDRSGWTPAGRSYYDHGYHSTALLLPDGSVLAAGPNKTMEIYHPWYTSTENRPTVASPPRRIGYGETFHVSTSGGTTVERIVLIRTSSVTHSLNTDQRYLEFEPTSVFEPTPGWNKLSVRGPASPGVAPPGYYLLFAVDERHVPSEGRFVRVGPEALPGRLSR